MEEVEIGQKWTHKLTSLAFRVAVVEGEEVLLEPEGDGQELTLTRKLLLQEFRCPGVRRSTQKSGKSKRRIKPGKIRRGARR